MWITSSDVNTLAIPSWSCLFGSAIEGSTQNACETKIIWLILHPSTYVVPCWDKRNRRVKETLLSAKFSSDGWMTSETPRPCPQEISSISMENLCHRKSKRVLVWVWCCFLMGLSKLLHKLALSECNPAYKPAAFQNLSLFEILRWHKENKRVVWGKNAKKHTQQDIRGVKKEMKGEKVLVGIKCKKKRDTRAT